MQLYNQLKQLGACQPALDWIKAHPGMTLEEAWQRCQHGRWMIWLLRKSNNNIPLQIWQRLAYDIATTVMHLIPIESQACMTQVKQYLDGDTSIDIVAVRKRAYDAAHAAYDAYAAYDAAYDAAYAAAYAAYDAAYAADAAYDAADAAAYAAYDAAYDAAYAAAYAAYDAAYAADAAYDAADVKICDVIRKRFPVAPAIFS